MLKRIGILNHHTEEILGMPECLHDGPGLSQPIGVGVFGKWPSGALFDNLGIVLIN